MLLDVEVMGNKKRKRCGRVFRFKNFGEPGYPVEFRGPFRENVNALLEFANSESKYLGFGMPIWSFQLEVHRHPPSHIFLFVIEEATETSMNRHCKHCQYVGWGNHFICNKKYHFVLPSKETLAASLSCEMPCEAITGNSHNNGKSKLIELEGHMMQAVFHSNGFGHLLSVNGLETGSDLAGHQIMDFWDRLCTGLQARKVSLNDLSQKKGMELKLINGIAYGEPWFGRWGYKFGRGCFGVTESTYQKAIEAIRSIPLYLLNPQIIAGNSTCSYHDIPIIFSRYQTLSDQTLVTLGDLFHFMLELKSQLPRRENYAADSYNTTFSVEANCRWSPKRIEMATRVIVEALKRAEFRWISRQEVRDAARTYIGDTGLLDFVLKSLGNHVVGNYMVRRSLNPVTKVLEYCLEDISSIVSPSHHQQGSSNNNNNNTNRSIKDRYKITRAQITKDMFYLYKYILKDPKQTQGSSIFSAIPLAARIILDTKYLIKEYFGELPFQADLGMTDGKLSLHCTIMLRNYNNVLRMPPYECITLRSDATIDDLKLEVERNFREIYWGLRSFCVDSIKNLEVCGGNELVFEMVEVGRKLVVEGWIDNNVNGDIISNIGEICEVNDNNGMVVECGCGTKEDDGERMVCCDICETWQHTRCVRIPNDEQVPSIFLCKRCEQEIVMFPSLP
ncbi:PHD finger protein MALE STERILITY 1-like [Neltuma alba]|uniref:PHD finger protein MALE STERILITY 1-like n=1 Tax=Neltuma alba TaxID=207710 RepID=UPI0010A58DF2|nr:PHD finger protein MALE STERILITY 1-like [Prosopis alba]